MLAAYGEAAERVRAAFPEASVTEVASDWETRWREFHRPVRVGPLWIGPPWEEQPGDGVVVVIDPGGAFGTGAHATTRLCLGFLLEEGPCAVLDVGCGSGVLSIAAAKLGFSPVIGVDNATAAIDATRENAEANGVEVEACELDALTQSLPAADLVLANIALAAVEELGGRISATRVITSGYPVGSRPALEGFTHLDRRELDGWAADLFVADGR